LAMATASVRRLVPNLPYRLLIWDFTVLTAIIRISAIILALAWRRPLIGFVAFLLAAILFLRFLLGNHPSGAFGMLLLFSGPMAAIAMAFWANWKWHEQIQAR